MSKTLTARLDENSQRELTKLSKSLSKTESEIVRESIHLMAITHLATLKHKSRWIGLGQFSSDCNDLGSNKTHLEDFGK